MYVIGFVSFASGNKEKVSTPKMFNIRHNLHINSYLENSDKNQNS